MLIITAVVIYACFKSGFQEYMQLRPQSFTHPTAHFPLSFSESILNSHFVNAHSYSRRMPTGYRLSETDSFQSTASTLVLSQPVFLGSAMHAHLLTVCLLPQKHNLGEFPRSSSKVIYIFQKRVSLKV